MLHWATPKGLPPTAAWLASWVCRASCVFCTLPRCGNPCLRWIPILLGQVGSMGRRKRPKTMAPTPQGSCRGTFPSPRCCFSRFVGVCGSVVVVVAVVAYWLLDIGFWILAFGYWLLDIGFGFGFGFGFWLCLCLGLGLCLCLCLCLWLWLCLCLYLLAFGFRLFGHCHWHHL